MSTKVQTSVPKFHSVSTFIHKVNKIRSYINFPQSSSNYNSLLNFSRWSDRRMLFWASCLPEAHLAIFLYLGFVPLIDPDLWSKITWIMLHRRNCQIPYWQGLIAKFYPPWCKPSDLKSWAFWLFCNFSKWQMNQKKQCAGYTYNAWPLNVSPK